MRFSSAKPCRVTRVLPHTQPPTRSSCLQLGCLAVEAILAERRSSPPSQPSSFRSWPIKKSHEIHYDLEPAHSVFLQLDICQLEFDRSSICFPSMKGRLPLHVPYPIPKLHSILGQCVSRTSMYSIGACMLKSVWESGTAIWRHHIQ